jgi:hypothetical protein
MGVWVLRESESGCPAEKNIAIFYFPLCWFVRRPHPQGPAVSSASCWRCVWVCRLWMCCACSLQPAQRQRGRESEKKKKSRELGPWTLGCGGRPCHTVYSDGPSPIRTVRWQLGSAPSPFSKYLAARNPTAYPPATPPSQGDTLVLSASKKLVALGTRKSAKPRQRRCVASRT